MKRLPWGTRFTIVILAKLFVFPLNSMAALVPNELHRQIVLQMKQVIHPDRWTSMTPSHSLVEIESELLQWKTQIIKDPLSDESDPLQKYLEIIEIFLITSQLHSSPSSIDWSIPLSEERLFAWLKFQANQDRPFPIKIQKEDNKYRLKLLSDFSQEAKNYKLKQNPNKKNFFKIFKQKVIEQAIEQLFVMNEIVSEKNKRDIQDTLKSINVSPQQNGLAYFTQINESNKENETRNALSKSIDTLNLPLFLDEEDRADLIRIAQDKRVNNLFKKEKIKYIQDVAIKATKTQIFNTSFLFSKSPQETWIPLLKRWIALALEETLRLSFTHIAFDLDQSIEESLTEKIHEISNNFLKKIPSDQIENWINESNKTLKSDNTQIKREEFKSELIQIKKSFARQTFIQPLLLGKHYLPFFLKDNPSLFAKQIFQKIVQSNSYSESFNNYQSSLELFLPPWCFYEGKIDKVRFIHFLENGKISLPAKIKSQKESLKTHRMIHEIKSEIRRDLYSLYHFGKWMGFLRPFHPEQSPSLDFFKNLSTEDYEEKRENTRLRHPLLNTNTSEGKYLSENLAAYTPWAPIEASIEIAKKNLFQLINRVQSAKKIDDLKIIFLESQITESFIENYPNYNKIIQNEKKRLQEQTLLDQIAGETLSDEMINLATGLIILESVSFFSKKLGPFSKLILKMPFTERLKKVIAWMLIGEIAYQAKNTFYDTRIKKNKIKKIYRSQVKKDAFISFINLDSAKKIYQSQKIKFLIVDIGLLFGLSWASRLLQWIKVSRYKPIAHFIEFESGSALRFKEIIKDIEAFKTLKIKPGNSKSWNLEQLKKQLDHLRKKPQNLTQEELKSIEKAYFRLSEKTLLNERWILKQPGTLKTLEASL
ncbi:MAG: hypothetical protein CL678_04665 [Bdellovibrionaceae bacterium]|nr:hypothetical protein [Pseudobdellovibrionaceae bacterium]